MPRICALSRIRALSRASSILLLASSFLSAQQQAMPPVPHLPGLSADAQAQMASISPTRIGVHDKFLASDLLEGRGPGTRGSQLAANYIATQFALLGLEPAGDYGTYLQRVPMVNVTTDTAASSFSVKASVSSSGRTRGISSVTKTGVEMLRLSGGSELTATTQTTRPVLDIDAPIVFVNYGIVAPEYGWNDYANVDVKGKVVMAFYNEPPSPAPSTDGNFFKGPALTYYGRWTYKQEEAVRQGAIGLILIHRTEMAAYPFTILSSRWGAKTALLANDTEHTLQIAGFTPYDTANRIFSAAGVKLDDLLASAALPEHRSFELDARFESHLVSTIEPFDGANVVARLPGSGTPAQRAKAVLYSAHYDHFGRNLAQTSGDNIYNGAVDNAEGDGMLLELARAYTQPGRAPASSILFAALDAEEQGLLGATYLARHPPVPAQDIVLDLNFEGLFILPIGVPEDLLATGAEATPYAAQLKAIAAAFGMTLQPDPLPAAGYYFRSDHFSLARIGVPAFSLGAGDKYIGHDLAWGKAQAADFIAHRYHQPSDEYSPALDFRNAARLTQIAFALGWQVADVQALRP